MLKSKSIIPHDRPVYREVIPQALKIAWRHPQYWLLGLFAAFLNTGGAIDVCWKFWNSVQNQSTEVFLGNTAFQIWSTASYGGLHVLPFLQALLALIGLSILILAVGAFSCISQGSLIHAIGFWKTGNPPSMKKVLFVGGRALVPIAVLNLIVLTSIWFARFFISLPLAMILSRSNGLFFAVYLVSFIVFFLLALVLSVIQIYALNAMILQGASLAEAFRRAWLILKEHWLVTVETALIQALLIMLVTIVALVTIIILCFPPVILYVLAVIQHNLTLFYVSFGILSGMVLIFLILLTGFVVTFQYALWTLMYRKLGEGGVAAKLHRLFRFATRRTKVPQS